MESKQNNFDKEFSLNQKKKKSKRTRGKLPPWLMILAGTAVIGGVIAARQPAIHPADNGTHTAVNMPAGQMVSGDQLVYNTVNDHQVDSSELEAHLISQGEQGQQLDTDTSVVISEATPTTVPVDSENQQTAADEEQAEPTTAPAEGTNDKKYTEETVAWLNNKAYSVSVKPADEVSPAPSEKETERNTDSVNVPVRVFDTDGNEKKQPQTTLFELNGKEYALELSELTPADTPAESPEQSVVWIDTVPLNLTLSEDKESVTVSEGQSAPTAPTDPAEQPEPVIEISLNPLPAEQTAALQRERFGTDFGYTPEMPTEEPTAVPEEPTETITEEPQEENWFASFFSNIFGSDPTQTPTPQVTVIAMSPTPTIPQPTATPLVIRMEPTKEAEGPVRLDGTAEPTAVSTAASGSKDADIVDPALIDSSENTDSETDTKPTKAAPAKIDAVVVESFDEIQNTDQPEVQPTPSELPHTGGLEGWNVPSLLLMLAGLLLVILGVRKLRTKE